MFAGLSFSTSSYFAMASSYLPRSCSWVPASIVASSAGVDLEGTRVGGPLGCAPTSAGHAASTTHPTIRISNRITLLADVCILPVIQVAGRQARPVARLSGPSRRDHHHDQRRTREIAELLITM